MSKVPEPVRLIGNPEENFYVLGKKHQSAFLSLSKIIFPDRSWLAKWQGIKNQISRSDSLILPDNSWGRWLKAYCDGLEVTPTRYLELLEIIEKGHFNRFVSGSTSIFRWDENQQIAEHLHFVDWPLALHEGIELILIEAPKEKKLLLLCLPGLAFLPLSAMNSEGVSLALHPKYHELHHPQGRPISEAVIEGLLHAGNVAELRRQLKNFQTQRLWGLHALDAAGVMLVMDIAGPQLDVVTTNMREAKTLVFNNSPLIKNKERPSMEPPSFAEYSRLRREWCLERLQKVSPEEPALITLTRAHKLLRASTPAISISTIHALSFTPAHQALELLNGDAPQWQQGKLTRWSNLFQTSMRSPEMLEYSYPKEERQEWKVRRHLALAQKSIDTKDFTGAFHYMQMSLALAEGELRSQSLWIWSYWQWQHLKTKRERLVLYQQTNEVLRRTSVTHRQQVLFLRLMLEVDLKLSPTVTLNEFSGVIQKWAEQYLKSNPQMRQEWAQKLDIRLDIKDIIAPQVWTNTSEMR